MLLNSSYKRKPGKSILRYRYGTIAELNKYWHWRRAVSLIVLITFSSPLFSTVFASYPPIDDKASYQNAAGDKNKAGVKNKASKTKYNGVVEYRLNPGLVSPQENRQTAEFANQLFPSKNKYQPYLEVGGAKYFNQTSTIAGVYDLFIPLVQQDDQLLFTDLRIFDRSGGSFEGNAHIGYRKLYLDTKQMFGIYAAFDRKRSDVGNRFNQITLGFEYWQSNWFVGGNVYKPLSKTKKFIGAMEEKTSRSIVTTKYYEKSLSGVDAEIGYSFTDNVTGYVGGYYFHSGDTNTTAGPKARLTYNYNKPHGRILGILDGVSVEVGAQHDKPRGNTAYIGIKLKVGLTDFEKNSNISGFERHMVELVRRDPDIIVGRGQETHKQERLYQDGEHGFQEGDKPGDSDGGRQINKESKDSESNKSDDKDSENIDFMKWNIVDLLKELDLSKDATEADVKKRYIDIMRKCHPDKGGSHEAAIRLNGINDAIRNKKHLLAKEKPKSQSQTSNNFSSSRDFADFSTAKNKNSQDKSSQETTASKFEHMFNRDNVQNNKSEDSYTDFGTKQSQIAVLEKYGKNSNELKDAAFAGVKKEFDEVSEKTKFEQSYKELPSNVYADKFSIINIDSRLKNYLPIIKNNTQIWKNNLSPRVISDVYVARKNSLPINQSKINVIVKKQWRVKEFLGTNKYLVVAPINIFMLPGANAQVMEGHRPFDSSINGYLLKKITLLEEVISYSIDFLGVDLFYQVDQKMPEKIKQRFIDAIIDLPSEIMIGAINTTIADLKSLFINTSGPWKRGPPNSGVEQSFIEIECDDKNLSSIANYTFVQNIFISSTEAICGVDSNKKQHNIYAVQEIKQIEPGVKSCRNKIFSIAKTLIVVPLRWLDYVVNKVIAVLVPMRGAYALEVVAPIGPDSVIERYIKRTGAVDLLNLINTLNTIDDNSVTLNEGSIGYLKQIVKESYENKHDTRVIESAGRILANYAANANDFVCVNFLVDSINQESFNSTIRKCVVDKFAKNINKIALWCDNVLLDDFSGISSVYELIDEFNVYDYSAHLEVLPHFEYLLDLNEGIFKEKVSEFILRSLIRLLSSAPSSDFTEIQKHVDVLLSKTDILPRELALVLIKVHADYKHTVTITTLPYLIDLLLFDEMLRKEVLSIILDSLEKILLSWDAKADCGELNSYLDILLSETDALPSGLVAAIFKVYKNNQDCGSNAVVNIIAVDKKILPILKEFVAPINQTEVFLNIKEPAVALFIALRLAENHIPLSSVMLKNFIPFLYDKDKEIYSMVVSLFYQLKGKTPDGIKPDLLDGLITLLPQVSEIQRSKIETILEGIGRVNLNEEQQRRLEMQEKIAAWHATSSLEERVRISEELLSQINNKTATDLLVFFKENLLCQNNKLLGVAEKAFKELGNYQSLVWSEEEEKISILLNAATARRDLLLNETKFFITESQWQDLHEQLNDNEAYLKRIYFIDFREIKYFLNFVINNNVKKEEINEILDHLVSSEKNQSDKEKLSNKLTVTKFYKQLYKNLVNSLEKLPELMSVLPAEYKNSLKRGVYSLLEVAQWPADFLSSLIISALRNDAKNSTNNFYLLMVVLDRLANYRDKINPQTFNRHGESALAILEWVPHETLLSTVNLLIRDNSYFVETDMDSLLEEFRRDNHGNPLVETIANNFPSLNSAVEKIKKNWLTSRYELVIGKPALRTDGNIYLYEEEYGICFATIEGEKCFTDSQQHELGQFKDILNGASKEITFLYEEAIKANLVPKLRGIAKLLSEWKREEYTKWRQTLVPPNLDPELDSSKIDEIIGDNLAEILAVESQAAHDTYFKGKYYPRLAQLLDISVLLLSGDRLFARIHTGEGKSIILAMSAIIRAMQGHMPDIVTIVNELARRDVENLRSFYKLFGFGVDHNTYSGTDFKDKCYQQEIIYGDTTNYCADLLRDRSDNVKKGRPLGYLFADEFDALSMDQYYWSVLLGSQIPGHHEVLDQLFTTMYTNEKYLEVTLEQNRKGDICYATNTTQEVNGTQKIELIPVGPCEYVLKETMRGFINDTLGFTKHVTKRAVNIPLFMRPFVEDQRQQDRWLESLLRSRYFEEKVQIIKRAPSSDKESSGAKFTVLEIVDKPNSGAIWSGVQLSDGEHQFLQIGAGLTTTPESVVSIYISYVGFFNRLYPKFCAVSGTVGGPVHIEFTKNTYGADTVFLPPAIPVDRAQYPHIYVGTVERYQEELINAMIRNSAVANLVILGSIKEVEELHDLFVTLHPELAHKTTTYSFGGEYEAAAIKKALQPGDNVIATGLASRGTDLEITKKIEEGGGLHVINGVFPGSTRQEAQIIARGARKGQSGSTETIININNLGPEYANCTEHSSCLNQECDSYEMQKLRVCLEDKRSELEEQKFLSGGLTVKFLEATDKIFISFLDMLMDAGSSTGYKLSFGVPNGALEDLTLYLYAKDKKIKLKIVDKDNKSSSVVDMDITKAIRVIDPRAEKHINKALSNLGIVPITFSNQDYELIQFIVAITHYSKIPEIYERVKYAFNQETINAASKCGGGEKGYARWLLGNDAQFEDLRSADFKDCQDTNIDAALLDAVILRKMYFLWRDDKHTYNNNVSLRQISDDWGIFKKQNLEAPHYEDYDLKTEAGQLKAQELVAEFEKIAQEKFTIFKKELATRAREHKLLHNPSYQVLEARHQIYIYKDGKYKQHDYSNDFVKPTENLITIEKSYQADGITNVSEFRVILDAKNYRPKDPLQTGVDFCTRAITSDPTYWGIWAAYSLRALLNAIHNGAGLEWKKQKSAANKVALEFIGDTHRAIDAIEEWVIPKLEVQIISLLYSVKQNGEHFTITDETVIKPIGTIEVYKKMIQALVGNINIANEVLNKEDGVLRLDRFMPIKEITEQMDISQAVRERLESEQVQEVTKLHGITIDLATVGNARFDSQDMVLSEIEDLGYYLVKMEVGTLRSEKTSWWGTIAKGVLGAIFIVAGCLLPGGVFLTVLANSLIIKGVGDIISAAIDLITNQPADLRRYLSSTAIYLAAAVVFAAVAQFVSMVPMFNNLYATSIGNIGEAIRDAAIMQLSITGASMAFSALAKKIMVDEDDINAIAQDAVKNTFERLKGVVERIILTDELNSNDFLKDKIIGNFKNKAENHRWQFNEVAEAAMSSGGNLLFDAGYYITSGVHAIKNNVERHRVVGELTAELEQIIMETASGADSSENLFKRLLKISFLNDEIVDGLLAAIKSATKTHGLLISQSYDCSVLEDIQLDKSLLKYRLGMVEACNDLKERLKNAGSEFLILINTCTAYIAQLKVAMTEHQAEIIGDVAGHLTGTMAAGKVIEFLNEQTAKNEALERARKALENDEIHTSEQVQINGELNESPVKPKANKNYPKPKHKPDNKPRTTDKSEEFSVRPGYEFLFKAMENELRYDATASCSSDVMGTPNFNNDLYRFRDKSSLFDLTWERNLVTKYKSPILFSRTVLDNFGVDFSSIKKTNNRLDNFIEHHPRLKAYFESAADEALFEVDKGLYQTGVALSLGKNTFKAVESLSQFSWDAFQWSMYLLDHPEVVINRENIAKVEKYTLEAYQWSVYATEHPTEAVEFAAKVFKKAGGVVKTAAESAWEGIEYKFEQAQHVGFDNLFERGLADGEWISDVAGIASIAVPAVGGFIKGGKFLQSAIESKLIKSAEVLSVADKAGFVAKSEQFVAKTGANKVSSSKFEVSSQRQGEKIKPTAGNYRPDKTLLHNKYGDPVPDGLEPHTQLGKQNGRNGEYTQAREWSKDGKLVKDIDFTDHGRSHPNPHQHRWINNPTGGTPKRGSAEPLLYKSKAASPSSKTGYKAAKLVKEAKQEVKYAEKIKLKVNSKTLTSKIAAKQTVFKPAKPSDINNVKVRASAKLLPKEVPAGRLDYRNNFLNDLENFEEGTSKLHHGPLKEDLYLVNFHDSDVPLGIGSDKRTLTWATHLKVYEKAPHLEELHQHLGIVKPDWGHRNTLSIIKIPKGEEVTFISGKALWQESKVIKQKFRGGGFQVRFRDFDPKWIEDTIPLTKDMR